MTKEQCETILKKDRSDSKGIGVKNVNDRLKIYFGDEYGISIESELDVGTTVKIKIPKIEKGREMNIKRSIAFMLLASFLLCVLFGCESGSGFAPEYPRVAIIIKGSESDFWNDVKKGAYSAATEFNIDITFEGPENEEDYETQNKMIENAVYRNVGAIILSATILRKTLPPFARLRRRA